MSCCGKKRAALPPPPAPPQRKEKAAHSPILPDQQQKVRERDKGTKHWIILRRMK